MNTSIDKFFAFWLSKCPACHNCFSVMVEGRKALSCHIITALNADDFSAKEIDAYDAKPPPGWVADRRLIQKKWWKEA